MSKRSRRFRGALCGAVLAAAFSVAALTAAPATDHTRFWRQSDYEEFQKGKTSGVAIRSDGVMLLAPKFTPVFDPGLAYLFALRTDSHGNLYAAGGSNSKVIRIDTSGKQTTVFESSDMSAQTLTLDKNDNLYVGTAPDGKVYKVTPGGQKSVFFDPKTKYIWDLAWGADGTLYVATGDTGKIFSVKPDGKSELFFDSEETHIRALALDGKGNLIAGTEPNGWVIRIPLGPVAEPASPRNAPTAGANSGARGASTRRNSYVLYETARREVTAIVADASGNLYVSAIGEKNRSAAGTASPAQAAAQQSISGQGQSVIITSGGATEQALAATAFAPFPNVTSSSVYRIAEDGSPEELWSGKEDIVYALALSSSGKPLLGVGSRGGVIELTGDHVFTRLAQTESEQVTGFARAANGKLYVAAANPGKVYALGPELESQGTFESQTHDARIFSRWGRLSWWGANTAAANASVQFYVRTGNTSDPANSWSPWAGPYSSGAEVNTPSARFAQWKAVFQGGSSAPQVSWVSLAYLPKNVAPRIVAIAIQDQGVRVTGLGGQSTLATAANVQLHLPSSTGTPNAQGASQRSQGEGSRFDAVLQGSAQKGFQSVLWSAMDDNDDELTYAVYYRGENEKDWKLLKDKLDQKYYSWDTTSLPDGAYYLKIVVSDARSNTPQEALRGERESDRFVVDNTAPVISELAAQASGNSEVTVRFRAKDAIGPVISGQYSLDAGDWIPLRPISGLNDSPEESYALTLRSVAAGEHTISVRVYDQFENEAVAKSTFSVPAAKR